MIAAMAKEKRVSSSMDHLERGTSMLENDLKENEHLPTGHERHTVNEKALNRAMNKKLDFFLLPFLSVLYLFSALDRGNVVSLFQIQVSLQKVFRDISRRRWLLGKESYSS